MPQEQIIIEVDKDGQITVDAVGYKGKLCHSKLQSFLPVLGKMVTSKKKAEFYQDEKVRINVKAE